MKIAHHSVGQEDAKGADAPSVEAEGKVLHVPSVCHKEVTKLHLEACTHVIEINYVITYSANKVSHNKGKLSYL